MRYAIFSDIHSNLEAFSAVIKAYRKESIDKFVCAGDVVGYGANPKECLAGLKKLAVITVAGNHDWASVGLFSPDNFNDAARQAVSWTSRNLDESEKHFLGSLKLVYRNQDFTLVHGTLNEPQEFNYMLDNYNAAGTFEMLETDVCFVGHTHIAGVFIQDKNGNLDHAVSESVKVEGGNKYIVNVGSVGQPRDRNPHAAYCIFDTDERLVRIKRACYDIEAARKKILDAGLPGFLGDRLLAGQ